jgi:hypothetical protein
MKLFKSLIIGAISLLLLAVDAPQAQAQSGAFLPTANKIIYTSNAVEVQDSIQKVAYTLKKGAFFVVTKGFTGGTAAIIESASQRAVWRGPVSTIRIVGVIASDSLKILSLKTTPF